MNLRALVCSALVFFIFPIIYSKHETVNSCIHKWLETRRVQTQTMPIFRLSLKHQLEGIDMSLFYMICIKIFIRFGNKLYFWICIINISLGLKTLIRGHWFELVSYDMYFLGLEINCIILHLYNGSLKTMLQYHSWTLMASPTIRWV